MSQSASKFDRPALGSWVRKEMNERILVVDDESDILELLSSFLRQEGFRVKTANSGDKAIGMFTAEPFDLVISDMRMPGMDGLTLMRRLKEIDEDIEVIILTAFAALENVIEAFRHKGAFDYLTKPLGNINELFITVSQALESRRLKRENKALIIQLQDAKEDLEKRNKQLTFEIQERRRVEEQIRKSKMLLQSVFDGISEPLLMLDEDAVVRMLNKAAVDYFRTDYRNAVGRPCHEMMPGGSDHCQACRIPSQVKAGQPVSLERQGMVNPNRLEQVVLYPLQQEREGRRSAIIRISDITEARLMERQLMQSEKLASLGLLIAGIAHEINNPNNFISFNIPILKDYLDGVMPVLDDYAKTHPDYTTSGMPYPEFREDLFKLIGNIEHGSKRINGTVSGLKQFSRSKDRSERQWVDLRSVIERGVAICRGQIKKTVGSFSMNIPDSLPRVYTDPEVIEQVIVNLIINASQAADKAKSWITLGIHVENSWRNHVIIEITDNGCGMDETTRNRIFDPFFTTKAPGEGTGLGLYICQSRLEAIGGRIEVRSDVGIGSTFRVILMNDRKKARE